jgi:hypothetical protein
VSDDVKGCLVLLSPFIVSSILVLCFRLIGLDIWPAVFLAVLLSWVITFPLYQLK